MLDIKIKCPHCERGIPRKPIIIKEMKLEETTLSPQDQLLILEFAKYRVLSYADFMNQYNNLLTWQLKYTQLAENDEGFIIVSREGDSCGWPKLSNVGVIISMLIQNNIKFSIDFNPNITESTKAQWLIDLPNSGFKPLLATNLHKGLLEQIFKLAKKWKRNLVTI